jgi:hypothetical protein
MGRCFLQNMVILGIHRFPIRSFLEKNIFNKRKEVISFCRLEGMWGAVPGGFSGGTPRRPPGARLLSHSLGSNIVPNYLFWRFDLTFEAGFGAGMAGNLMDLILGSNGQNRTFEIHYSIPFNNQ